MNVHIDGIMLTGSRATEKYTEDSDTDLVIVSKDVARQTSENLFYDNKKFHIILIPLNKIASVIFSDILNSEFLFYHMFKTSIIIYDPKGILEHIKTTLDKRDISFDNSSLLIFRSQITDALEYIEKSNETPLFTISFIISLLGKYYYQNKYGNGKYEDKSAIKQPFYYKKLYSILQSYLNSKNKIDFIEEIDKMLVPLGGRLKSSSTIKSTLLPINKDNLLIYIPEVHPFKTKNIDVKEMYNIFKSYTCEIFYIGQAQFMPRGLYFRVSNNSDDADFYKVIQKSIISLRKRLKHHICFPFQSFYSEVCFWGNQNCSSELQIIFSELSDYIVKENNNDIILLISYTFTYNLLLLFPQKDFVEEFIMRLLPEVTDTFGLYNVSQIVDRKETIICDMRNKYKSSKSRLKSLVVNNNDIFLKQKASELNQVIEKYKDCELFNSFSFSNPLHALRFNVLNHVLGIYGLESVEKLYIVYNTFNLIK
ncbi:nucleotidyltransferase domain-containing protein [Segatella bryantii]|uniref:nucleotidyltransferase domain-containing protein n=1 Tax=Segatella bryantii TaxID=77095 RepID=UPI001EDC7DE2|nr:nucleotidyltransferase domain-containing protein [Segatella bryantii]UKK74759.1 nucleotidyltransferase domain-containing protein [Segatella bryantii]